jgi:hypothetical protein
MNRPTLPTVEQSKSAYELLRHIKDAAAGLAPVGMIFAELDQDLYAKTLILMELAISISQDIPGNNLCCEDQAKNALCAIASLESSLAAVVMTRKAEELVEQAEADQIEAGRARLVAMT